MAERLVEARHRFPFVPGAPGDVVWTIPEAGGPRAVLTRLEAGLREGEVRSREDLVGSENLAGGSGGQRGRFLEIGDDFLKADLDRRYPTPRTAAVELDMEHLRLRLGVYPPHRLFFLSHGGDDALWACSLTPRLETLRQRFNVEFAAGAMMSAWDLYLEAFRITFDLAGSAGAWLDCNPNNFGLDREGMRYIDDDVMLAGSGAPGFGTQALLRLREYADADLLVRRRFLMGFAALVEQQERRDLTSWRLAEDFAVPILWPREPELREIIERLQIFLERR